MILHEIHLKNYKQHEDCNEKFGETITVVVGPNGTGKSNLIGAVQFALTGEQPGFNKADLLRWGSSEGYVRLQFEHEGVECDITRYINNSTVTLKLMYPGDVEEEITGITKVAEKLNELIGVDRDIMRQAVFVGQAEIDKILFTDQSVRERAFQRLMGVGEASKIHKEIGDVLSEFSDVPDYTLPIAQNEEQYQAILMRIEALQGSIDSVKDILKNSPDSVKLDKQIDERVARIAALEKAKDALVAMERHSREIIDADREIAVIGEIGADELENLSTRIEDLQSRRAVRAEFRKAYAEWYTAGLKVSTLLQRAPVDKTEEWDEQIHTLRDTLSTLAGRRDGQSNLLKALDSLDTEDTSVCPVCAHKLSPEEQTAAMGRIRQTIEEMSESIRLHTAELNNTVATTQQAKDDLAKFNREKTELTTLFTQLEKRYEEISNSPLLDRDKVEEDFDKEISELVSKRSALSESIRKLSTEKAYKKAAEKAFADNLAIYDSIVDDTGEDFLNEGSDLNKEIVELREFVTTRREARSELLKVENELEGLIWAVGELNTTAEDLHTRIQDLTEKRDKSIVVQHTLDTLGKVRDWFHYLNGPRVMSASVLNAMTTDINRFLGEFDSPFTVSPADEALGFVCHFHDGRPMPPDPPNASMLSGGQKVQLAVSFRFAAYTMFARKLGLLSLDEPTVYLDDANTERFCRLLQQVKEVAQDLNIQILISTHERGVIPYADAVIDLTP